MAETDNKPQEQAAAPQNVQSAAVPQQPTQQPGGQPQGQQKPCPKNCSQCSMGHQIYCTAQMTFDSFRVMNVIIQRIDGLTQMVSDLSAKIDAQSEKIAELSGRIAVIESEQSGFATPSPIQGDLFKEEK
jgi:hypothetical protein